MLCRYRLWGSLLAAMLLVGCGSLNSHQHKKATDDAGFAPAVEAMPEKPSGKLAQAHAHFAAGVIHDMNEETEAALEEFYKAALNDIENEDLVLEVTRRLLQNKQPEKALELLTRATGQPNA